MAHSFRTQTGNADEKGTWKAKITKLFQDHKANSEGVDLTSTKIPVTREDIMDILDREKALFDADPDFNGLSADDRYGRVVDHIIANQKALIRQGTPDPPDSGFAETTKEKYLEYLDLPENKTKKQEAQAEAEMNDAIEGGEAARDAGGNPAGPGGGAGTGGQNAPQVDQAQPSAGGTDPAAAPVQDARADAAARSRTYWATLLAKGIVSQEFVNRAEAMEALNGIFARSQRDFQRLADPLNYLSSSKTTVSARVMARKLDRLNRQFERLSAQVLKEELDMKKEAHRAYMRYKPGMPEYQEMAEAERAEKKQGLLAGLRSKLPGGKNTRGAADGPDAPDQAGTNPGKDAKAGKDGAGPVNKIYVFSKGVITKAFTSARGFLDAEGGKLKKSESKIGLAVGAGLLAVSHPLRTIKDMGHSLAKALSGAIEKNKSPETPPVTPESVQAMSEAMHDNEYGADTRTSPEAVRFMAAMFAAAGKDPNEQLKAYDQVIEALGKQREELSELLAKQQAEREAAEARAREEAAAQSQQPASEEQPAAQEQPASEEQQAAQEQPASEEQQAVQEQPAPEEQQAAQEQPAPEEQQAAQEQPASEEQQAAQEQPASEEQQAEEDPSDGAFGSWADEMFGGAVVNSYPDAVEEQPASEAPASEAPASEAPASEVSGGATAEDAKNARAIQEALPVETKGGGGMDKLSRVLDNGEDEEEDDQEVEVT